MFLFEIILWPLALASFIWFITTILVAIELVYFASLLGPTRFYCGLVSLSAVLGMVWNWNCDWIGLLLLCFALVSCPLRLLLSRVVRIQNDPLSSSSDYRWMLIVSSVPAGIVGLAMAYVSFWLASTVAIGLFS